MILAVGFMAAGSADLMAQAPPAVAESPAISAPVLPSGTAPMAVLPAGVIVTPQAPVSDLYPTGFFITPDEQARIYDALATYEQSQLTRNNNAETQGKVFLNQLQDVKKLPKQKSDKPFTYPQFFLETLAYHTPDDWMIQVNQQKIYSQMPPKDSWLTVVSIDDERVVLEWAPEEMDRVAEVWQKLSNDNVNVDIQRGTVTFTLHPNQTFSSFVMDVLEGKVQPVTVAPPVVTNPSPAAPGKAPDGVSTLLDTYKKVGLER